MNELAKFQFQGNQVRTIDKDGAVWFVAKDVCDVLGLSKHRDAVARLDEDERGTVLVDTLGGAQEMAAVNESGLYKLIFKSRKKVAKTFTKWVTSEVLPAIRRTGGFGSITVDELRQVIVPTIRENEQLRARLEIARNFFPKGQPGDLNRDGNPKNQFRRGYYVSRNGRSVSALIERMEQPGLFDEIELTRLACR